MILVSKRSKALRPVHHHWDKWLTSVDKGVGHVTELGNVRRRVDVVLGNSVGLLQDHIEILPLGVYCCVTRVGTARGCGRGAYIGQETGSFVDLVRPNGVPHVVGGIEKVPSRVEGHAMHAGVRVVRDILEVGLKCADWVNPKDIRTVAERVGINVVRGLVCGDDEDTTGRAAVPAHSNGGIVAEVGAILDCVRGPANI